MKKIYLVLLIFVTSFSFAFASSKEIITKDFELYSKEVNPKITVLMEENKKHVEELDSVMIDGAKKDIKKIAENIDKTTKELLKFMESYTAKFESDEIKAYHKISIEYIKSRDTITKEIIATYNKNKKITKEDLENIQAKYIDKFTQLDKDNAEALKNIQSAIH